MSALQVAAANRRASSLTLVLPLVLASPLFVAPAASASSSITGQVQYDGAAFRQRAIRMSADPQCEALREGERVTAQDRLVSENGGVANVFVYVDNAPAATETPSEPVTLGQQGCMYTPRVFGIRVNQTLEISNSDPVLHNVRCLARDNRPFNIGQPAATKPRQKTFQKAEKAVRFKCDVHPWMEAIIFVMEHDFWAVTDGDGKFSIPGLPAGTYKVVAWHETFGEQEAEVNVDGSGAATLDFSYSEARAEG